MLPFAQRLATAQRYVQGAENRIGRKEVIDDDDFEADDYCEIRKGWDFKRRKRFKTKDDDDDVQRIEYRRSSWVGEQC